MKCRSLKVLRPLGLAITVADYMDLWMIPAPAPFFRCLDRYILIPSLHQLRALDPSRDAKLKNEALERQHSLGAYFTREALADLSSRARAWTPSARHSALSCLAAHAPEAFTSPDRSASTIVAWISCRLPATNCSGRLSGFKQSTSSSCLPPLQVEHDRQGVVVEIVEATLSFVFRKLIVHRGLVTSRRPEVWACRAMRVVGRARVESLLP